MNLRGNLIDLRAGAVMGILNITPDSFYKGSRHQGPEQILEQAEKMISEGALILDVGGYSSRPGAQDIGLSEEIDRVIPAIALICKQFPKVYVSVDTFRAEVARQAIGAGACMVNDISGGTLDEQMFSTVASLQVPYVLMHMRGTPQTMKANTHYDNLLLEVLRFFEKRVHQLTSLGVKDILLDPGFGFAKTIAQNFFLLRNLSYFKILNRPLLVGLSRKSMVYKTLNTTADQALYGTIGLNTLALSQGASLLRVHDVKAAMEVCQMWEAYQNASD